MSSTSKKNKDFMGSPLSEKGVAKSVASLPGVGKVAESKLLKTDGIEYAHQLLGIYLLYNFDRVRMIHMLRINGGMTERNSKVCLETLEEYIANNLGLSAADVKASSTIPEE